MVRHIIPARDPAFEVALGWDNAMSTYFAIVKRKTENGDAEVNDPVVLWLGGVHRDYPRVEDMIEPLAPHVDLTPKMIAMLRFDRAVTLDRGPTPIERMRLS